jgi:hypothetical protein
LFNNSPRNDKEDINLKDYLQQSATSLKSSIERVGEDNEWEKVSFSDLNLEGMNDPYANKFKNITNEIRKISEYSIKYESW